MSGNGKKELTMSDKIRRNGQNGQYGQRKFY